MRCWPRVESLGSGLAAGCPGGKGAGSGFGLSAMGSAEDKGWFGLPNPY